MGADPAWKVAFTRRAQEDLREIASFMADRDGPDSAEMILGRLIEARDRLAELPERGRIPPELSRVGILSYREIQVRPYRVIYQVNKAAHAVHIHLVADGRRNFSEILKERLLTPR